MRLPVNCSVIALLALACSCQSAAPLRRLTPADTTVVPFQFVSLVDEAATFEPGTVVTGLLGGVAIDLQVLDATTLVVTIPEAAPGTETLAVEGYEPLALDVGALTIPADPLAFVIDESASFVAAMDIELAADAGGPVTPFYALTRAEAVAFQEPLATLTTDDARRIAGTILANPRLFDWSSSRLLRYNGDAINARAVRIVDAFADLALSVTYWGASAVTLDPVGRALGRRGIAASIAKITESEDAAADLPCSGIDSVSIELAGSPAPASAAAVAAAAPGRLMFRQGTPQDVNVTALLRPLGPSDVTSTSELLRGAAEVLVSLPQTITDVNAKVEMSIPPALAFMDQPKVRTPLNLAFVTLTGTPSTVLLTTSPVQDGVLRVSTSVTACLNGVEGPDYIFELGVTYDDPYNDPVTTLVPTLALCGAPTCNNDWVYCDNPPTCVDGTQVTVICDPPTANTNYFYSCLCQVNGAFTGAAPSRWDLCGMPLAECFKI